MNIAAYFSHHWATKIIVLNGDARNIDPVADFKRHIASHVIMTHVKHFWNCKNIRQQHIV